ncbi:hypothetical protein D3C80_1522450 [compost metagenome]
MPATLVKPGNTGTVARLERGDAWPDFLNHADAFVAQYNAGLVTEVAIFHVQVGVADTAALHLQQRFAVFEGAQGFLYHVHATAWCNNSSFHKSLRVYPSELGLSLG